MLEPIDNYCERLGAGLWAEPLNALTNVAFFMAAWFLWRRGIHKSADKFLLGLLICIGIGSALFHSYANRLASLLDVVPIALFLSAYLWVFLTRIAKCAIKLKLFCLGLFIAAIIGVDSIPEPFVLNGSVAYAPALLAMTAIVIYMALAGLEWKVLLAGEALFILSLTLRTLDLPLCAALPMGTHFLWHMLNACTLYVYLDYLIEKAAGVKI